jgi:hypothetical protein
MPMPATPAAASSPLPVKRPRPLHDAQTLISRETHPPARVRLTDSVLDPVWVDVDTETGPGGKDDGLRLRSIRADPSMRTTGSPKVARSVTSSGRLATCAQVSRGAGLLLYFSAVQRPGLTCDRTLVKSRPSRPGPQAGHGPRTGSGAAAYRPVPGVLARAVHARRASA